MQGSKHVRRTYGEARDFVYYLPAALDGKLSIVKEELRADLAEVVQLLIVLVCLSSGKKPATKAELEKAWGECTVSLYKHVDALSRHITPHLKAKQKKKRKASKQAAFVIVFVFCFRHCFRLSITAVASGNRKYNFNKRKQNRKRKQKTFSLNVFNDITTLLSAAPSCCTADKQCAAQ